MVACIAQEAPGEADFNRPGQVLNGRCGRICSTGLPGTSLESRSSLSLLQGFVAPFSTLDVIVVSIAGGIPYRHQNFVPYEDSPRKELRFLETPTCMTKVKKLLNASAAERGHKGEYGYIVDEGDSDQEELNGSLAEICTGLLLRNLS